MATKTRVEKAEQMLKPKLEEAYDPQSLIALVPIHTDQDVADVGSGPGWLSMPLAKYLYGGKLYAIDVQEGMLKKVAEQAETYHLKNVATVPSKESAIPLEDSIVDGLVLADTLNEATRAKSLLKESARLLRKSGWLAVIEWLPVYGDAPPFGPPAAQRIPVEDVLAMGAELGLSKIRSRQIGSSHYVVVFKK
jgi:ubiquinone/menaquinone biosynthesis C-methylase UbiE